MHQTKKGNQWHFGMKVHIGVDVAPGLVHTMVGSAANEADINQMSTGTSRSSAASSKRCPSADLPPAVGEQVAATARALSLGGGSLAAAGLRGLTMSHSDWIHASGTHSGLRTGWQACSARSMSSPPP